MFQYTFPILFLDFLLSFGGYLTPTFDAIMIPIHAIMTTGQVATFTFTWGMRGLMDVFATNRAVIGVDRNTRRSGHKKDIFE